MDTTTTQITSKASVGITIYLTLAQFKSQTIIDFAEYSDAVLQEYVDRAHLAINQWLGGSVGLSSRCEKDIRVTYDYPKNGLFIQLPHRPIVSVEEITVTFSPSGVITWDTATEVDNWRINETTGYLEYFGLNLSDYALNLCLRDPTASNVIPMAEVVYSAGYYPIPTAITKATLILTEQFIRSESGDDVELTSIAVGNYRETRKRSSGIKSMGMIGGVDQVERLLRPYRQANQTMFTNGPLG